MEPNAWKGFFRSYVLGQWYCYIFNMILKNNNQDLNWYWNALWLSSHSFWKLRNCIQASKWKKSWVGVQVFACDVAVESDHVVIRNSRSQFKTTSSSRKSEGDFTPCDDHQVRSWDINSYVTEKTKQAQLLLIARISLRQFFQGLHFPRYMFSSYQVCSSMSKTTQSECPTKNSDLARQTIKKSGPKRLTQFCRAVFDIETHEFVQGN